MITYLLMMSVWHFKVVTMYKWVKISHPVYHRVSNMDVTSVVKVCVCMCNQGLHDFKFSTGFQSSSKKQKDFEFSYQNNLT